MTSLREYHERTKHSPASVRASAYALDWDNQPIPFKVYPDLEPIAAADGSAGIAAPGARGDRRRRRRRLAPRARRRPAGAPPLLHRGRAPAPHVPRRRDLLSRRGLHRRALPCGCLRRVRRHRRSRGGRPSFRTARLRAADAPGRRPPRASRRRDRRRADTSADAPVLLVLTSTFWRNAWKYRTRTYRHCFWDAGTLVANLLAVTAALGVPAHVVTGFVDDDVARLLDIDQTREAPLAVHRARRGRTARPAGTGPAPPRPRDPAALARGDRLSADPRGPRGLVARDRGGGAGVAGRRGRAVPARRPCAPMSRSSRCRPPPYPNPSRPSSRDADRHADSHARPSRSITSRRSSTSRRVPYPLDVAVADRAARDRQCRRRHRPRRLPVQRRRPDARAPARRRFPRHRRPFGPRPRARGRRGGESLLARRSRCRVRAARRPRLSGGAARRRRSPEAAPISRPMRSGSGRPDSRSSTMT